MNNTTVQVTSNCLKAKLAAAPLNEIAKNEILGILNKSLRRGNCCIPLKELVESASRKISDLEVKKTLLQMVLKEEIVTVKIEGQELCYLTQLWKAERRVAELILARLAAPYPISDKELDKIIGRISQERGITLHPNQEEAIRMAGVNKLAIMTGGPGCGKTWTSSAIVATWKKLGRKVILSSPTGRASAKLAQGTGEEAKTLHKLLEYSPDGIFKRNASNPIDADAILVDEASMIDLPMMLALLEAVRPDAQILFVGDVNQLPSVGPGKILKDLIDSGKMPITKLTTTFRQGSESKIITVAKAINEGKYPEIEKVQRGEKPETDCFLIEAETPEEGLEIIKELIETLVPELGFNPTTDVQLLCPMKKGNIGTIEVNKALRDLLNPPSSHKTEIEVDGLQFRVGERVIQTKNRKEVKNGDVGTIESISNGNIKIKFPKEIEVEYTHQTVNQLLPAWCISTHKSQGSEYPVAIIPMFEQSKNMMNRNWLYTAITRAKKLAIIVGQASTIEMAAKTDGVVRTTMLSRRLIAC